MMLRLSMALAVLALAAATATMASAATYVHGGTTTGNVLSAGTTIGGGLKAGTTATVVTSVGTVTCSSGNAGGSVGASGGATVSGNLTALTASHCTDTIPLIDVTSCSKDPNVNPVITVDNTGKVSVAAGNVIICQLSPSGTCTYTSPTTTAQYDSSTSTLNLTNIPVSSSTGGLCPASGTFNGVFSPVTATSGPYKGSNVIVNGTP